MPIRRARCGRCQAKSADNTGCLIEHFGNADAVPQLPERCLSRKAGIVRCCLRCSCTFADFLALRPKFLADDWFKIPLYISNAIFIKIVDFLFLQKVVARRFPIFTSKISSFIEKRLKIGGARARQLFRNNEQLPKGKHKERPDS